MVEVRGDRVYLPELLRLKAGFLPVDEAERCLRQSIDVSRSQGALSWQLRAASDLALLLSTRGRSDEARALLQPVYAGFTEGHDTPDLKAAYHLLEELH
jgi:predicted ATPase